MQIFSNVLRAISQHVDRINTETRDEYISLTIETVEQFEHWRLEMFSLDENKSLVFDVREELAVSNKVATVIKIDEVKE